MSFNGFTLTLPQPTQAQSRSPLQRPYILAAGDVESLPQPGFRLRLRRPRLLQEQDAPEARDFRYPPAFLMLLYLPSTPTLPGRRSCHPPDRNALRC